MATIPSWMQSLAAGMEAGSRSYRYDRGSYDGQMIGRGDGFDIIDRDGHYTGKVVRSPSVNGFDVFDGRNLYQGTIKR